MGSEKKSCTNLDPYTLASKSPSPRRRAVFDETREGVAAIIVSVWSREIWF